MSHIHDELRDQIAELRREIEALKALPKGARSPRAARTGFLVLAGLLIGLIAGWSWQEPAAHAAQDKDGKDIVCSSLKVVGAGGRTLTVVGSDADGGFIQIFAPDGKERAFIGVDQKQEGGLVYLNGTDGKARSVWNVNRNHAVLSLRNPAGKDEIWIGSSYSDLGGVINVNGTNGKARFIMEVDKKGLPGMYMNNNEGALEVFLGSYNQGFGGLLNLNSPAGPSRVIMGVNKDGHGFGEVLDSTGKVTGTIR